MKVPAVVLAAALARFALAVSPEVDLGYSKYVGSALPGAITQWLGIRFAAPPVGELRFRAPQKPLYNPVVQQANAHGPICLAVGKITNDTSEDCLFLDVYAPSSATPRSKLPVFVYIQGGGFAKDGNANSNGTGLIQAADMDLIVVVFNYRVGAFGFLTTGDVTRDDIDSNVGLLDQRMVLEWVQEHIEQFGGDPRHVVLGGASAGAASVTLHLTAYDGRDRGLFIGTAAESASFGPMLTAEQSRYQFVALANSLGCHAGNGSNDTAVLECIRSCSAADVQNSSVAIPYPAFEHPTTAAAFMWGPFVDGDLIRGITKERYLQGYFFRVPSIFGDDQNGGTSFAPKTTSTLAASNAFMRGNFPTLTDAQLSILDELYPNPNASACPAVGCYWRQASNVYGETRYMCPSFFFSDRLSSRPRQRPFQRPAPSAPSYTYLWDVEDPTANATGVGVGHVVETFALFGVYNNYVAGAPASYFPGQLNAKASPVIQAYWASFIRTLDPNRFRYPGSAEWKPWANKEQGPRLRFGTGGTTDMEIIETGLQKRCEYLESIGLDLLQ